MSLAGNVAVEAELEGLQKFVSELKGTDAEKLAAVVAEIEARLRSAKSGWL
jgi:hypothetical protein